MFLERSEVSWRAEYIKEEGFHPQTVEGLPFKDSEGEVDLDDIVDYLRAEGFIAKVNHYGAGFSRAVKYLDISLEK